MLLSLELRDVFSSFFFAGFSQSNIIGHMLIKLIRVDSRYHCLVCQEKFNPVHNVMRAAYLVL
jgi:hypothetical protein